MQHKYLHCNEIKNIKIICLQTWNKRSRTHQGSCPTQNIQTCNDENRNSKYYKTYQEAKAKNKPTKLSRENNHQESNLVVFS